ncbi:hypothetical protein JG688_00013597, partial [Phytophthora aleatoria]
EERPDEVKASTPVSGVTATTVSALISARTTQTKLSNSPMSNPRQELSKRGIAHR